jgi:hypothetical protein
VKFREVIRAAIPGASDELCNWVLWERTAWPMERPSARALYRAASGLRRAEARGEVLCDFCNRLAEEPTGAIMPKCGRCRASLQRLREASAA